MPTIREALGAGSGEYDAAIAAAVASQLGEITALFDREQDFTGPFDPAYLHFVGEAGVKNIAMYEPYDRLSTRLEESKASIPTPVLLIAPTSSDEHGRPLNRVLSLTSAQPEDPPHFTSTFAREEQSMHAMTGTVAPVVTRTLSLSGLTVSYDLGVFKGSTRTNHAGEFTTSLLLAQTVIAEPTIDPVTERLVHHGSGQGEYEFSNSAFDRLSTDNKAGVHVGWEEIAGALQIHAPRDIEAYTAYGERVIELFERLGYMQDVISERVPHLAEMMSRARTIINTFDSIPAAR